jgi:uncharacterized protein YraI
MASSETWLAEYFDNMYLGGQPVYAREYQAIDFDWGYGSPGPGPGADNFSARFVRILDVSGRYRFKVTSDDGVRLWVDNRLVIDEWHEHAVQTYYADVNVGNGALVKLAYFEAQGLAEVHLSWEPLEQPLPPPGTGGPFTAFVNARHLNMRDGPGLGYSVIGVLGRGTAVTMIARNEETSWVRVQVKSMAPGWVAAAYLSVDQRALMSLPLHTTGEYAAGVVSNCHWLNIRSGPGVGYSVLTAIPRGTVVTLTSNISPDGRWTNVILPNGRTGWANNHYFSAS